jgi:hypothetical protein
LNLIYVFAHVAAGEAAMKLTALEQNAAFAVPYLKGAVDQPVPVALAWIHCIHVCHGTAYILIFCITIYLAQPEFLKCPEGADGISWSTASRSGT